MSGNKRMRVDSDEEKLDPSSPGEQPSIKFVGTTTTSSKGSGTNNNKIDETNNNNNNNRKATVAHVYKLKQIKSTYCDNRRTNDEIHSSIQLLPVVKTILDTPPMQRLRGLKQLATADQVYINCGHTRFEHSLGVAYLAGKTCKYIRTKQPCFNITYKDELCIILAGLMHDIGHGPFSHSYEEFILNHHKKCLEKNITYKKEYETKWPALPDNWSHEMSSLMMIDAVLTHLGLAIDLNHLDEPLQQIGDGIDANSMRAFDMDNDTDDNNAILTSRDFIFIKECIYGKPIPEIEEVLGKGFHGRYEECKEWLYDIVANCKSGLDVDKVDYFARDARRALRESGEIDKVMIEEAVVAWGVCTNPTKCYKCCSQQQNDNNNNSSQKQQKHRHYNLHLMICYPEKLVGACMSFFKQRFRLHSTIYHHKTNDGVQMMLSDIFCKADPYFTLPVTPLPGQPSLCRTKCEYKNLPLSRAMIHPGSYLRLRDSVIDTIANTENDNLIDAQQLIGRYWERDFYKCVCEKVLQLDKRSHYKIWNNITEDEIINGMISLHGTHNTNKENGTYITLNKNDLIVQKFSMHHGLKDKDPLSQMRFLEKRQLKEACVTNYKDLPIAKSVEPERYDSLLPKKLMQCTLRIYSRNSLDDICELTLHVFEQWWDEAISDMQMTKSPKSYNKAARMCTQDSDDDDYDLTPPRRDNNRRSMSITPPKSDIKRYLPKEF